MKKIGVFVCHCGINIAGTVDIPKVIEKLNGSAGLAFITDYKYLCSDPGQEIIKKAVKEYSLDGVVVAACSPTLHENTFRKAVSSVGLNPYMCEIANIREQCSWVHRDKSIGTPKATKIVLSSLKKTLRNENLIPISTPITKRALIIGGGIAGIQSALDIASSGYEVVLVEKSPSIGGRMSQLSETFPTLDCSQCILTPKMVECSQHPKIKIYTYSEIENIDGYLGNFKVRIKVKPAYLDRQKCNGCGLCIEKCPAKTESEFDVMLGKRKAIYVPFPQAVPNKPVIDKDNCLYFTKGICRICEKVCSIGAIDFTQGESFVEEKVGAVVVATGYGLLSKELLGEYGYGKYPDVIDGLQFERLLSASGPSSGKVVRLSDGNTPKEIVFIQCAGSRETEHGVAYCSKICCMYTAKHATLYKHRVPDGNVHVFYIDIRSGGKTYEEFVQKVQEQDRVKYYRGKVSKVYQKPGNRGTPGMLSFCEHASPTSGKVVVKGVDTLTGEDITLESDMVVLATAIVPEPGTQELTRKLKVATDTDGFLTEAHPKLRPVESLTAGIFLAGCAQGPKDIPETVAQSSACAGKIVSLFSSDKLLRDPVVVCVDENKCSGCRVCISVCPYAAREFDAEKKVAKVNEVLCEGCGACVSACGSGASTLKNVTDLQMMEMISAVLE